jgi:hypothetical protein
LKRILLFSILLAFFVAAVRFFLPYFPTFSPLVFKSIVSIRSCIGMKNKVVAGNNGWLFYEPELTYIQKPLPRENIESIITFDRTLKEHGIALFVVPVPNKIDIYPERFSAFPASHQVKPERRELLQELEKAGVRVVDLVPAFTEAKAARYFTRSKAIGPLLGWKSRAGPSPSALFPFSPNTTSDRTSHIQPTIPY